MQQSAASISPPSCRRRPRSAARSRPATARPPAAGPARHGAACRPPRRTAPPAGRPHLGRRLQEPRQIAGDLLGPRAGEDRHQRTGPLTLPGDELLIERPAGDIVEERVPHQRRVAAALAEPRLLKRQTAQDVVDQPPHLPHPPLRPRPDLRRRIIKDRDADSLGPPRNPPVQARIVDQHHGVGPMMPEIFPRLDDQVPKLVEMDQHPGEPHHGQRRQVGVQTTAGGGHVRPAVTDRLEPLAAGLQLANQASAVQIAAGLSGGKEDRKRSALRARADSTGWALTVEKTTGSMAERRRAKKPNSEA